MNLEEITTDSGIYCFKNVIDNKMYVGKSINILRRIKSHINDLKLNKSECSYLQNAWNKYGEENFVVYIIENCPKESLTEREIYFISKYKTKSPNGYNLTIGGDGNTGYIPTEVTLLKQRSSHLGKKLSQKTKSLLREINTGAKNPFFGKKHTDETKEVISQKGMGRKNSEETSRKKSLSSMGSKNPIFGKKFENSSSIYYGVSFSDNRYWSTQLRKDSKILYLGKFKSEIHSAIAHDMGVMHYYEGNWNLNFPELKEKYISYLNQYEILDIKQLRKIIKDFIEQEGSNI